ncbi:sporulation protein YunB [Terribacillus saccharophilus]|uniref:sporulation protein YunB n=1 Tax=Terribacillus saccharophilus TaxID=361277 RepID=UPI002DCB0584|nr:sporulation protein YunB [Terribacillus saccharophilus]
MRPWQRRASKASPSFRHVLLMSLLLFLLFTSLSLWLVNRGLEPTLMAIAETKTEQFAKQAINQAVQAEKEADLDLNAFVQVEKDTNGNVTHASWDAATVNEVLRKVTFRVQNYLRLMEDGQMPAVSEEQLAEEAAADVIQEKLEEDPTLVDIPLGQATNNALLANLGPRIPVKFEMIGYVESGVDVKVEEYGINNAMFVFMVEIKANVRIIIPFSTKTTTVTQDVLLGSTVIQGQVPEFYNNGGESRSSPSFSIPMQKEGE